jgi:hypothetical protein
VALSTNKTPKKLFLKKSKSYKNAELYADFKTVQKIPKNSRTKSYRQKCDGKLNFFYFYSYSSNWFPYNFLCVHFLQLFNRSKDKTRRLVFEGMGA